MLYAKALTCSNMPINASVQKHFCAGIAVNLKTEIYYFRFALGSSMLRSMTQRLVVFEAFWRLQAVIPDQPEQEKSHLLRSAMENIESKCIASSVAFQTRRFKASHFSCGLMLMDADKLGKWHNRIKATGPPYGPLLTYARESGRRHDRQSNGPSLWATADVCTRAQKLA